jgi:hypothetical protein
MTIRTRETTLTFRRAFAVSAVDHFLVAGTYRLVVDEEDIPDLSFPAFRRTATMLHVPALSASGGPKQVFLVDGDELAAAADADRLVA